MPALRTRTSKIPKWANTVFKNFLGLNTISDKTLLGTHSPDLQNVRHIVPGYILPSVFQTGGFGESIEESIPSIRTRTGYAKINTQTTAGATATVKTGYNFVKNNTDGTQTNKLLVYTSDGGIWDVPIPTTFSNAASAVAWTNRGTGFSISANIYGDFETFNNRCIFTDGTDAMQIWDGTAATFTAVVPDAWVTRTTLTTATANGIAFNLNDFLYFAGGETATAVQTNSMYQYNVFTDSITTKGILTTPRGKQFGGTLLGAGFVAHGSTGNSNTAVNTIERYDSSFDTWTQKTAGSTARNFGASGTALGRLYCIAGTTPAVAVTTQTTTNDYYEPVSDSWTTGLAALPAARDQVYGASIATLIQVPMGGDASNPQVTQTTNYQFNATGNAWTTKAVAPAAQTSMAGTIGYNKGYWAGNAFYQYDFNADSWTTKANPSTQFGNAFFANSQQMMVKAGGRNIGTFSNVIESYNTNAAPPAAYYLQNHRGYLFAARSNTYNSRVWYSFIGTHDVWNPNAYVDIGKDDGGFISGIEVFGNGTHLLIFKTTGIYAIEGTVFDPSPSIGNFSVRKVSNVGCASGYAIVKVAEGFIYFLGIDGRIYEYNGIHSRPLSDVITPTILGFSGRSFAFSKAVYFAQKNEIWFSFANAGSTTNNRIIVYNILTNSWFLWIPNVAMDSLFLVKDTTLIIPSVFSGGSGSGLVYIWDNNGSDIYADDGVSISSYFVTPWTDFGQPGLQKLTRRMYLYSKQTGNFTLLIDAYVDTGTGTDQSQQTLNLNNADERGRVDLSSRGHQFQWKFSLNTINQFFDLEQLIVFWIMKGGGLWTD